jgi:DNA-binding CsgD family transcriptional regulator
MDDDDKRKFWSKLSKSFGRYAETYPSTKRRLVEVADSDDPFIRKFNEDMVAADQQREMSRRKGFADRFGLTEREARVAMHLAGGGSIADYALRYGVSEQTVRSQLKAIFAKTGVNRQSALVGLLLGDRPGDPNNLE